MKPVVCVGIVCWKNDAVLLIKRANEPRKHQWSIPGGRLEFGETLEQAGLRELFEETGITARIAGLIDIYEIIQDGLHYVLIDYHAHWLSDEVRAGDDALEARFVSVDEALVLLREKDLHDVVLKSHKINLDQSGTI